jgi:hypothetical protein
MYYSEEEENFSEKRNFVQCHKCASYYDGHNSDEVLYHQFDHSGSRFEEQMEEAQCSFCGHHRFAARKRNGIWQKLECEQCGMPQSFEERTAA